MVLNVINIYVLNETQFTKKVRESSLFFDKTAPIVMLTSSTLSLFSPDKREELQHDLSCAAPSIEDWKSHVLRSVHQDAAKSEIVDSLKPSQVLLIIDWAMNSHQLSRNAARLVWKEGEVLASLGGHH